MGLWVASDRYISINGNGRLEYKEKLRFGMHNRVQASFAFEGDTITAMLHTFEIHQPPTEVDGEWTLVLDGVRFVKRGPPVTYGNSDNWPAGIE